MQELIITDEVSEKLHSLAENKVANNRFIRHLNTSYQEGFDDGRIELAREILGIYDEDEIENHVMSIVTPK